MSDPLDFSITLCLNKFWLKQQNLFDLTGGHTFWWIVLLQYCKWMNFNCYQLNEAPTSHWIGAIEDSLPPWWNRILFTTLVTSKTDGHPSAIEGCWPPCCHWRLLTTLVPLKTAGHPGAIEDCWPPWCHWRLLDTLMPLKTVAALVPLKTVGHPGDAEDCQPPPIFLCVFFYPFNNSADTDASNDRQWRRPYGPLPSLPSVSTVQTSLSGPVSLFLAPRLSFLHVQR